MKKVIVIGCPGSGKSTFARALHEKTGLPLVYLDRLYWNADRTTVDKATFRARLLAAMERDAYIIDGNYGSTMELRMKACDTVFFLDYDTETCLSGIRARRGKERPDMPWIEYGEDAEFVAFVRNFATESRPKVLALLETYAEKQIYVFRTRAEADAFLETLES